jgi:hypothetical protein
MKTLAKNSEPGLFSNPIIRNLILILVITLTFAIGLVTTSVILYYQW